MRGTAKATSSAAAAATREKKAAVGSSVTVPSQVSLNTVYIIVAAATLACFFNAINDTFVFDDRVAVVENNDVFPNATSWTAMLSNDFWGQPIASAISHKSYRPLTTATYRLNVLFGGLSAWQFHLTNVLLQFVAACLFAKFCDELFGEINRENTTICSLLFATHPIHVEAVTSIVGRAELLSAIFFLMAFLRYKQSLESQSRRDLALCALFATAAMFSKETGFMVLPFCGAYHIFVHLRLRIPDLLRAKRLLAIPRSCWTSLLFLAANSAGLIALRLWISGGTMPPFSSHDNPVIFAESVVTRVLTYMYLHAFNAWLLIFPHALCADWAASSIPLVTSFDDPRVAIGCVFYAGFIALSIAALWYSDKESRSDAKHCTSTSSLASGTQTGATIQGVHRQGHSSELSSATPSSAGPKALEDAGLVASSANLRTALPTGFLLATITFLPASHLLFRVGFVVADRVLYMPSMGFCMLVTYGLYSLMDAARRWQRGGETVRIAIFIVVGCIVALYSTKTVLRNEDWASPLQLFRSAVQVNPLSSRCHSGLGDALKDVGDHQGAARHYEESLRLWPTSRTHNNYGMMLKAQGLLDEAERQYLMAYEQDKLSVHANRNLGNLYKAKGLCDRAVPFYRTALQVNPSDAHVHSVLADCLHEVGNLSGAVEACRTSLQLAPNDGVTHLLMARLLVQQQDFEPALTHYDTAVRVLTQTERVSANLERLRFLTEVLKRRPVDSTDAAELLDASGTDVEALTHVAKFLHQHRLIPEAVKAYTRLLKLLPHHPDTVFTLAKLMYAQGGEQVAAADRLFNAELAAAGQDWMLYERQSRYFALTGRKHLAAKALQQAVALHARLLQTISPSALHSKAAVGASAEAGAGTSTEASAGATASPDDNDRAMHLALLDQLAMWQSELGDDVGSEITFRAILDLDPTKHRAHAALANVVRQKDQEAAKHHFKEAIRLSPKPHFDYHLNLGALYHLRQEYPLAVEQYEIASSLDPNHEALKTNRERLRTSKGYRKYLASLSDAQK